MIIIEFCYGDLIAQQQVTEKYDDIMEDEYVTEISDQCVKLFGLSVSRLKPDEADEQCFFVHLPGVIEMGSEGYLDASGFETEILDPTIIMEALDKKFKFHRLVKALSVDTYCPKEIGRGKMIKQAVNPQWVLKNICRYG